MIYIPSLNPYSLSVLSHGCIITLLVVLYQRGDFSATSCSEITRFRAQLRPVHNYTFVGSASVRALKFSWTSCLRQYADLKNSCRSASASRRICSVHICVTHCLLHDRVSWMPEPSPIARIRPIVHLTVLQTQWVAWADTNTLSRHMRCLPSHSPRQDAWDATWHML